MAKANEVHPSIKFDFNYSSNSVNFLDTTVKKSSTVKLSTTLFKKETHCQAYLHRKSERPEFLKRSIPYVQPLFLKRICAKDCDFEANCDILWKNSSTDDIKRLKYMTVYQKHLTRTGKTY